MNRFALLTPGPVFCAVLALVPSAAAYAHHSLALYSREIVEIEGDLVSVDWRNPHIYFSLNTNNAAGEPEQWTLEAATIYSLERRGVKRELFAIGDRIRVAGRPSTRQERTMWADNMLMADGTEVLVDLGSAPRWGSKVIGSVANQVRVDAAKENLGIFRVWSQLLSGERGTQSFSYRGEPRRDPEWRNVQAEAAARCESLGMPAIMMGTPYPIQLIDRGATIELLGLSNNARITRTIQMTGDTQPSEELQGRMGHSVGHWDGTALEVHTKNIDWPFFLSGVLHERRIETTERFALSEDQSRLDYRITVTAPDILAEPGAATEYYAALGETLVEPSNCLP